ncbi:MAG: hypothetical protein FWD61_08510 [Phycisphaerales bacterium]|nr:hypothetical protein [Phycisphaerales bacterium]
MTILRWYVVMAMMMLATGCIPERVSWSPDGTRGLVLGDDGVHVCDVAGTLTGLMIPGETVAAWMPDGKRVVVLREGELKNWKEIETAYPEEAAEAKEKADDAVRELAEVDKKWREFSSLGLTFFYLRDEKPETIREKLSAVWEDALRHSITRRKVQIYDLSGPEAKAGATLAWLPETGGDQGFSAFRVSPTGQAVAISRFTDSHGSTELIVAATDGSGIRIRKEAAYYPDWTPDGKYLVYIMPACAGHGDGRLGTLVRQKMVDDQGGLLKKGLKPEEMPKEEECVTLVYNGNARVRVLKDGRIFFTAADIQLPATPQNIKSRSVLFSFNSGGGNPTILRVMPPETEKAINDDEAFKDDDKTLAFFDVSPDGKRVSLVGGDGQVMVMDVGIGGRGKLYKLQPNPLVQVQNATIVSLPSWRTVDELTFIRPRSDGKGNEVVRYNLTSKAVTVISRSWPIEVTDRWLDKKATAEAK